MKHLRKQIAKLQNNRQYYPIVLEQSNTKLQSKDRGLHYCYFLMGVSSVIQMVTYELSICNYYNTVYI